jgi:hypothetical protein
VEERSPRAPDGRSSVSGSRAKLATVWVTNATKAVGLLGGAKQVLFVEHPNRDLVVLCIVFVVGAQAVEDIVMHAIDRIFSTKQE